MAPIIDQLVPAIDPPAPAAVEAVIAVAEVEAVEEVTPARRGGRERKKRIDYAYADASPDEDAELASGSEGISIFLLLELNFFWS